jgi:hypothetical protein
MSRNQYMKQFATSILNASDQDISHNAFAANGKGDFAIYPGVTRSTWAWQTASYIDFLT